MALPSPGRAPEVAAGRELTLLRHGELAVVAERIDPEHRFRVRDDLLAHSELLNALAASGPVIPIAFGSVFPDETHIVEELLEPRQRELTGTLGRLEGRAQFTVRARYVQDAVLAEVVREEPEIARLRAATRDRPEEQTHGARVRLGELVARAVDAKRQRDVDWLLMALAPLADDHRVTPGSGLDRLADVSLLVATDRQQELEARAEDLAADWRARATLRLLGPLAAFDFVGEPEGAG
ncbi:GvpL/GvpF family gas vesicle protein [Segeticoccus sp.]|uniref:GvpL/GvpF family gas vesicle protein n=1 Tax=Segeticoccus sp. TaxID=2706531 RepID=UPI002D80B42D|nr:GvpL/GvpF family gas vesicle protein [Segeticoccus sp.]